MNLKTHLISLFRENKVYVFFLLIILIVNLALINFCKERNVVFTAKESINWQRNMPDENELMHLFLSGDIYAVGLYAAVILLILIFIAGIILDFIFIFNKIHKQEPIPRSRQIGGIKWHLIDIVRFIIIYLFIGQVVSFSRAFLFKVFNINRLDEFSAIALSLTISYILIISILLYFALIKYKGKIQTLGLYLGNFIKNIFLGIKSYIALAPFMFLIILIVYIISSFLKYPPESPHPLLEILFKEERRALWIYFILLSCLIGPVVEEIFFRGFIYPVLKEKLGSFKGVILSSLLFAGLHMTWIGFTPILILGILLAYLYEKNGTLIPSITVHVIHNTSIVILFILLKGLII